MNAADIPAFCMCVRRGLIGMVVPNWRAPGHRLFRRHWYALEPPRQADVYEPRTLDRTFERAGFRVENLRTTSVSECASALRTSWQYRTGRRSPRPLLAPRGGITLLASLVADDAGEEDVAWARKLSAGRLGEATRFAPA